MDYAAVAERFLVETFPRASIAIVAGSTARGERTASSDIDLLLIGEHLFDDDRSSMAATYAFDGEVFEVFAYTPAGFEEWAERDVAGHRPVIVEMLVKGTPVRRGLRLGEVRERWAARLAEGPALSASESAFRRYMITDLLDDLRDCTDPLEAHVISTLLFERTAELMLLTGGQWIGTGKWLPRRLRDWDAARADALAAPLLSGDRAAFTDRVQAELDLAGGRVQSGLVR